MRAIIPRIPKRQFSIIVLSKMSRIEQLKTLQVFNIYRFYGGEENTVRLLSDQIGRLDESRWADCFFDSGNWHGDNAPSKITQAAKIFYNKDAARKLEEYCVDHCPDVLLFHNVFPIGSPSLYRQALKMQIPVIQYIHNFRPFSMSGSLPGNDKTLAGQTVFRRYVREVKEAAWQESKLKSLLLAAALGNLHLQGWLSSVGAWISQTHAMKALFIEAGVPAHKIHVLLPPRILLPRAGLENNKQSFFLFVGRLVEEKGVRVLLDAWERMVGESIASPRLIICGEGPLSEEVISRVGKVEAVEYLGRVSNERRSELLSSCKAVVVPSVWPEILGLVVFEAYEYCKPVLAARSGGLTEIVTHGKTGFCHEPGDSIALVSDIRKLDNMNSNELNKIGLEGRSWLEQSTCPKIWEQRYQNIAKECVEQRSRS